MSTLARFCGFMNTHRGRWIAIIIGVVTASISANQGHAAVSTFEGIRVEVIGDGPPLMMIPGLNSAGEVWIETCQALQPKVQCHIVQLPGFAGLAPALSEHWLADMSARLLRYVDAAGLDHPAIIGHSLGGVLGVQLNLQAPKRFGRLIIVDSLPFFAATRIPNATAESVVPMAQGMRAGMLAADDASYQAQLRSGLASMSNQSERLETLARWGAQSDRATTAQAMYEIMTTDLRDQLADVQTPTLVLGAWAGYAAFGATAASVRQTYAEQYAQLQGVRIELSDTGYHFLMWDDPQWLRQQVLEFLQPAKTTRR
ncbi:MAG: alpha/beta fold hydrolase [Lysobacterales bacterium]